jgi:hypothetical protein
VAAFFDCAVTIYHQPYAYWQGTLNATNERNPVGNFMMNRHQRGIFILSFAWLAAIMPVGMAIPKKVLPYFNLGITM